MDRKRRYMAFWKKLDGPGHETGLLHFCDPAWHLTGSAVFVLGRRPCLLQYHVICDAAWRTKTATVAGWIGGTAIDISIRAAAGQQWVLNGVPCPEVSGCIDVDLNFSPSTNLLSIRRLDLPVGGKAEVAAAWLRFPDFALEPLEQTYHRIGKEVYRYRSGSFAAELQVNADGFVTCYPGLWQAEGYVSMRGKA